MELISARPGCARACLARNGSPRKERQTLKLQQLQKHLICDKDAAREPRMETFISIANHVTAMVRPVNKAIPRIFTCFVERRYIIASAHGPARPAFNIIEVRQARLAPNH